MEFKPYKYQQYVIDCMVKMPYVGAFLDMGLGKTVITLSAIRRLKYEMFCIRKVLIIAPKKVAESTWSTEAEKWDHLRLLRVSVVLGTATQRKKALEAQADVYVINRENTQWLVDYYGREWPFDVVVLDESSSFKNHRAKRFRALKSVRPRVGRLIELTGTPSPHGLQDLWAQVYLLDGGERLGRTISVYREMYFVPDQRSRDVIFSYRPRAGATQAIYNAISDICVSMRAEDYIDLPDVIYNDIPVLLDKDAQAKYDALERDMLLELETAEVTAENAASLSNKLLQMCNGAVYDEDGNVVQLHDCKIEMLLETLEGLGNEHALIYYHYKHDLERLRIALRASKRRVRVYHDTQDLKEWNAGKIDILLAQPASCGYGLNLQQGGHHVIWFGLTWNLEEYQQANARLHRQGQAFPVTIHRLAVKGGIDEDVIRSLNNKGEVQDGLIEALKARIERIQEATT